MRTNRRVLSVVLRLVRGHIGRITTRADNEARAAGLTVEAGPGGVRRYRDPRMDQLAPGPYTGLRVAAQADVTTTVWSTPTLTFSASLAGAGWSR